MLPNASLAETINLKCKYLINHVDKGPNTPDYNWISINKSAQQATVVWRDRIEENTVKAALFTTASNYTMKHVGSFWTTTWIVNRTNGAFTRIREITENLAGQGPLVDKGKCVKEQLKTVF